MKLSKLIGYIITGAIISGFSINPSKTGINLLQKINIMPENEKVLVWIYFTDKGLNDKLDELKISDYLTEKSIDRRLKRTTGNNYFNESDLPVNNNYINDITDAGIKIRHKSKWFNAVSCFADKNQIEIALQKNFVSKIELVARYRKNPVVPELSAEDNPGKGNISYNNFTSINYGQSLAQDSLINVPEVHNRGYTGEGVLIASFDAGFDNLNHICFNRIRDKGLRTFDFVNGDTIVANGNGRLGNGAHGTITLSLIAGYDPGFLVSPAFDSRYILAKTENTNSETPVEEDNWIAAAEWADSLGADIITCSLGYLSFEPPYTSYTWQSMDGNTALITRAADLAVSKGIVVVISAGNEGFNNSHNTLNAPADAFNVITVGSVNLNRQRSSFSSVGPTFDGRIKPEVMALGSFNYAARPGNGSTGYSSSSTGTSLACPMVAGVCALLLSAKNTLTPAEIKQILISTSDNNLSPDNLKGWGTVNASYAIDKALGLDINIPAEYRLSQNYPNPFNPGTTIRYSLSKPGFVQLKIYDISGKEISSLVSGNIDAGSYIQKFTPDNISGGIYFYSLNVNGITADTKKMIYLK